MIKKKIFYLSVNGSDAPLTMEMVDILNKDEMMLTLANELKTTVEFIKIVHRRDNILTVFSVRHYLDMLDPDFSLDAFQRVLETVQESIPSINTRHLLYLWLAQFPLDVLVSDRETLMRLQTSLPTITHDLLQDMKEWKGQYDQQLEEVERDVVELDRRTEVLYAHQCPTENVVPFAIRKTRVAVFIPFQHSLSFYFDKIRLSTEWTTVVYKDMVRTNGHSTMTMDNLNEILRNRNPVHLTIIHHDLEQTITIQDDTPENPGSLMVVLDVRPTETSDAIRQQIQRLMDVSMDNVTGQRTLSVSGTIYFKNLSFHKLTLQDFLMNDALASRMFYVNELEKAQRLGETLVLHFEDNLTAILISSRTDTSPKPPSLQFFQDDYIKVNVTRASGSPNDLENVLRFQEIACAVLRLYVSVYPTYLELYTTTLPQSSSLTFPTLDMDVPREEVDITNFADKYKSVFRKTGYKTSCRPKSRMPTIITEEEAKTLPPLRVIQFPKEDDPKLTMPQEYLTCTDPDFPFPGITSLAGGSLFVPCCFNKNPRSSRAFLEYYRGERRAEPRGSEHVKSQYQIIKTFGDVGRLPTLVHQFLLSLMPQRQFFRLGTHDRPTSILHSLNHLRGGESKSDQQLLEELTNFFGDNVNVARQENWNSTNAEILASLSTDTEYIDPRRFIRLLETYFDVNIIVFTKSKKTEDLEIMMPAHKKFHIRYRFDASKPFVFLYEHWGTSPDRYTRRRHPVCEMIVTEGQRQFIVDNDTIEYLNMAFRNIFRLSPLSQNLPPIPPEMQCRRQIIDTWGKCRGFVCEWTPNRFVLIQSAIPLPPIYIPNENETVIRNDDDQIRAISLAELQRRLPSAIVKDVSIYKNKSYVRFEYASHVWRMQVVEPTPPTSFPYPLVQSNFPEIVLDPQPSTNRIISPLSREKQLVRMLLDYTLYLYSKHAMDSPDFNGFFQRHASIRQDYVYPDERTERVDGNPEMMKDDVVILPSIAFQDRLRFNLQYHLLYRHAILKAYKDIRFLPHFYKVPYDFEHWKDVQYIQVWERQMMDMEAVVVDRIDVRDLDKRQGYWFNIPQNPKRERHPYRYLRVDTAQQAIGLTDFWYRYKYLPTNVADMDVREEMDDYTVRVFDPEQNVWSISTGMSTSNEGRIQVYLANNREGRMYVFFEIKN